MSKTGSLRDYMADIALSNVRSGGGSSGGGELPENYLYSLSNIDTITLYGKSGKLTFLEEFKITEDTTSVTPTVFDGSNTIAAAIKYKNNIRLGINTSIYMLINLDVSISSGNNTTSIFLDMSHTPSIICDLVVEGSTTRLWSITIQ